MQIQIINNAKFKNKLDCPVLDKTDYNYCTSHLNDAINSAISYFNFI